MIKKPKLSEIAESISRQSDDMSKEPGCIRQVSANRHGFGID
jgi:hypothetical protein